MQIWNTRLCPSGQALPLAPAADHLAAFQRSCKAALRFLPANPRGLLCAPPTPRVQEHSNIPAAAAVHTCPSLNRQLASVIPLLTQGPVSIEHIIEICCSQIPASNLASGATQFSHQRPYCPPTGQHRAQSRFNEFRGPFFPTSLHEVGTRTQTY